MDIVNANINLYERYNPYINYIKKYYNVRVYSRYWGKHELVYVTQIINFLSLITAHVGHHKVIYNSLQWRHNERNGVSNHQRHDCLLNRLFRLRSKKTSKVRITGLCEGNSPVTGEFPAQRVSKAENVSIWWRHHESVCFLHWSLLYVFQCIFYSLHLKYTILVHIIGLYSFNRGHGKNIFHRGSFCLTILIESFHTLNEPYTWLRYRTVVIVTSVLSETVIPWEWELDLWVSCLLGNQGFTLRVSFYVNGTKA